jgi:hypothetical protein
LNISFSLFESSTFPHLFPFSPPGSFFKSGNPAWLEHHQKLEDHFSGFSFTFFSWEPKLLRDVGGLTIFVFLPEWMKNHDSQFLGFSLKLKKPKYHSCQHKIDSFYAMHYGFCFCSTGGTQTWKLFQETSIPFLKSVRGLLIHVEKLLLAFCPSKWRLQKKQIPENFGLFSTFWTAVVENSSFSMAF